MKIRWVMMVVVLMTLLTAGMAYAAVSGGLEPGSGPIDAASQMVTLEQIYDRLDTGAAETKMTTFTEPVTGPGATMHTLDEIMGAAPALDNTNGATVTQVLTGATFWGLTASQWATQTGTMADKGAVTIVPTTTVQSIAAGYHNGSGTVAGDANLAAGNIKSGVTIFGVDGTLYNAGVPSTGVTVTLSTGDDGDLQKGVAWPNPRFITDTTGVVTDTLTGLIWLQDANCIATEYPGFDNDGTANDGRVTSQHALDFVTGINSGTYLNCGASHADWRLPNVREMQSIVHYGFFNPAVPNTAGTGKWSEGDPFKNVQTFYYWSSTSFADFPGNAWNVDLDSGDVFGDLKTYTDYVWPVRGGQ